MKKTYYEKNKELCKERSKKWNYEHYGFVMKQSKEYYLKNTIERIKYYYKRDKYLRDTYCGLSARQSAVVGIENAIVVYKRSKGLCEQCGARKKKNNHHFHHIDESGKSTWKYFQTGRLDNSPKNLLLLCSSCHQLAHK